MRLSVPALSEQKPGGAMIISLISTKELFAYRQLPSCRKRQIFELLSRAHTEAQC